MLWGSDNAQHKTFQLFTEALMIMLGVLHVNLAISHFTFQLSCGCRENQTTWLFKSKFTMLDVYYCTQLFQSCKVLHSTTCLFLGIIETLKQTFCCPLNRRTKPRETIEDFFMAQWMPHFSLFCYSSCWDHPYPHTQFTVKCLISLSQIFFPRGSTVHCNHMND